MTQNPTRTTARRTSSRHTIGSRTAVVAIAALALTSAGGGVAHAKGGSGGSGGGSSSGAWPVTSAPLPAGTIISQSSGQALVLSPLSVSDVMAPLDAAYLAKGYTIHPGQVNVDRQYDGPHVVRAYRSIHDPSGSYVSMILVS